MNYRVVIDTNLVISAFLWGGTPYALLNDIVVREIPLLTIAAMLSELDSALRKPKFSKRFHAQQRTVDNVMDEYRRLTTMVTPADIPAESVRDRKDGIVLAAAVGGSASHVVSGDNDLIVLGSYSNIAIVTAAALRTILNAAVETIIQCVACDGYGTVQDDETGDMIACEWCKGAGYVYRTDAGVDRPIPDADYPHVAHTLERLEAERLRALGYTGESKKPWEQAVRKR
jgi:hypothetical protein